MTRRIPENRPRYVVVKEHILNGVRAAAAYARGSRILSESGARRPARASAARTVRRALSDLASDGVLERRHGCGTFVALGAARRRFFAHPLCGRAQRRRARLLSFGGTEGDRHVAARLALPAARPRRRDDAALLSARRTTCRPSSPSRIATLCGLRASNGSTPPKACAPSSSGIRHAAALRPNARRTGAARRRGSPPTCRCCPAPRCCCCRASSAPPTGSRPL